MFAQQLRNLHFCWGPLCSQKRLLHSVSKGVRSFTIFGCEGNLLSFQFVSADGHGF